MAYSSDASLDNHISNQALRLCFLLAFPYMSMSSYIKIYNLLIPLGSIFMKSIRLEVLMISFSPR